MKEDLFELTTFVNSETFEKIANGEQNEILRVLYPSNRAVFIEKDNGDEVALVGYNAIRLVDIVKGQELRCEIVNAQIVALTAENGDVYPYSIRGRQYTPEGIVFELGNVLTIEEDETDK